MTPRQIETELETAGLPAVVFKSEAAKKIGVSVELLYNEIARGNIPWPADKGIIERGATMRDSSTGRNPHECLCRDHKGNAETPQRRNEVPFGLRDRARHLRRSKNAFRRRRRRTVADHAGNGAPHSLDPGTQTAR